MAGGKVVVRAKVWQFMVLPVARQELDRVQFRSISWQPLDGDPPRWLLQVVPDKATAMAGQAVPYYQHLPPQVARGGTKKVDPLLGVHRPWIETKVGIPERDARDGREGFPVEVILEPRVPVPKGNRGLASGRPGPHPLRTLTQSALIGKTILLS